jgi:3-methyladenine DNA glycosylase/8-oxoguanine DNA glycosylase
MKIFVPTSRSFSFRHTIRSHGWYDLPPFVLDDTSGTLGYVFSDEKGPVFGQMEAAGGGVQVGLSRPASESKIADDVRRILRLDESLSAFYHLAADHQTLYWAVQAKAGRLLRSPTVFEDLVKTICTTNCSWSLTRSMVKNIVEKLGPSDLTGRRAFPDAAAMAVADADFYRNEVRAGYRSHYFVELAESVAGGRLDPESWLVSDLPTADLKKEIKKVKGVGDYAAENLLKLLGRYDGLALDSWLRAGFYAKHNRGKKCPDTKIAKHYGRFGDWKGLAIWCDMTEGWFGSGK